MTARKLQDEFTDLPITRQYRWQLRNPEKARLLSRRYRNGETYKEWYERTREARIKYQKAYQKKYREKKKKNEAGQSGPSVRQMD